MHNNTLQLALHVICGAGYGYSFDWEATDDISLPNHRMTFRESLRTIIKNITLLFIIPRWMFKLPLKRMQSTIEAYGEVDRYLQELIDLEKNRPETIGVKSILKLLVDHSVEGRGTLKERGLLQDRDIIGNAFVFLLGGHESTYPHPCSPANKRANTLVYALYLLALHPPIQEKIQQEIQNVCGDKMVQFNDLHNLVYSFCVMYETMRLFPVVGALSVTPTTGHDETLLGKYLIPQNSSVRMDLFNLNRNEKYWGADSNEFKPERFDNRNAMSKDDSEVTHLDGKIRIPVRAAWFGFSDGPRACVGMDSVLMI
jgi:cytochrome P450